MSKPENYGKRAPLVTCLCLLLLLAIACIAAANAHARPHGITGGGHVCFDKHQHKVMCPPKKHHHHKKHHKKHHRHTSESKCIIVVNGEKTVTHGKCPPVNVEPQSSAESQPTPEPQPAPSSNCEQIIEGKEVNFCQPSVVHPVCVTYPGEVGTCNIPSDYCEKAEVPHGTLPSCEEFVEKESPCAEKICEPLPEEECPEEKGEVAGPKG